MRPLLRGGLDERTTDLLRHHLIERLLGLILSAGGRVDELLGQRLGEIVVDGDVTVVRIADESVR